MDEIQLISSFLTAESADDTSVNMLYDCQYMTNYDEYSNYISDIPKNHCEVCDKFLLTTQLHATNLQKSIVKENGTLALHPGSKLCNRCFQKVKKLEIPQLASYYNMLCPR